MQMQMQMRMQTQMQMLTKEVVLVEHGEELVTT